ncbi:MAG TPA: hypothetical protein VGF59_21925 [Bryobacteraceae bacterium]|jgi:hypothetical protein
MKTAAAAENLHCDLGTIWLEPGVDLWREFLRRVQGAIIECNGAAGERIWEAVHSAAEPWRVIVRSVLPGDSVAIDYDPVRTSLACRFGAVQRRDDLKLPLSAENAGESADSVLNALIFPQED